MEHPRPSSFCMSAGVLLERTGGEAAESKGWGESCDTEQACCPCWGCTVLRPLGQHGRVSSPTELLPLCLLPAASGSPHVRLVPEVRFLGPLLHVSLRCPPNSPCRCCCSISTVTSVHPSIIVHPCLILSAPKHAALVSFPSVTAARTLSIEFHSIWTEYASRSLP